MTTVLAALRVGELVPRTAWAGTISDRHASVANVRIAGADTALHVARPGAVGELRLAIVGNAAAMHALAILLPRPLVSGEADAGTIVTGEGQSIALGRGAGRLFIDLRTARVWRGTLPAARARRRAAPAAVATFMRAIARASGKGGGFLELYRPHSAGSLVRAAARRLMQTTSARNLGSLVGLGYGLTPSGDDFIAGAFLAATIAGVYGWHTPKLPVAAIGAALNRTNAAGRTLLAQALDGRFPAYLHGVRRAVDHFSAGRVEQARATLALPLAVGHSSGTDAVCGSIWLLERSAVVVTAPIGG